MVGSLGLSACTAPVEEAQVDAVEAAPTPAPEPEVMEEPRIAPEWAGLTRPSNSVDG